MIGLDAILSIAVNGNQLVRATVGREPPLDLGFIGRLARESNVDADPHRLIVRNEGDDRRWRQVFNIELNDTLTWLSNSVAVEAVQLIKVMALFDTHEFQSRMVLVDVLELRWIEFGVIAQRPEDLLVELQRQWTVDHSGSASESGQVHLAEDSLLVLADHLSFMYSNNDFLGESILPATVVRVAHARVDAVLIEFHRG